MMRAAIPAAATKPLMAVWRAAAPPLEVVDVVSVEVAVEVVVVVALPVLLEPLVDSGAVALMPLPLADAVPPTVEVTRKAVVKVLPSLVPVEVVAKVMMVVESEVVTPVAVRPGPAPCFLSV